jgi:hypothetical protein
VSAFLNECEHAGLDPKAVGALARRISKAAKEAGALGLTIFGGAGGGSLRWHDVEGRDYRKGALVVAHLDGQNFDGGDGAEHVDEMGLTRGENA